MRRGTERRRDTAQELDAGRRTNGRSVGLNLPRGPDGCSGGSPKRMEGGRDGGDGSLGENGGMRCKTELAIRLRRVAEVRMRGFETGGKSEDDEA